MLKLQGNCSKTPLYLRSGSCIAKERNVLINRKSNVQLPSVRIPCSCSKKGVPSIVLRDRFPPKAKENKREQVPRKCGILYE